MSKDKFIINRGSLYVGDYDNATLLGLSNPTPKKGSRGSVLGNPYYWNNNISVWVEFNLSLYETKSDALIAFNQLTASIDSIQFDGVKSYQTKVERDLDLPIPAEFTACKIVNDGANNGTYAVNGGVWVLDSLLFESVIDKNNVTKGVNGKAVFDSLEYKANLIAGKNKFNKDTVVVGYFMDSNGYIGSNPSFDYSDFIKVSEGDVFKSNYNMVRSAFFDSSKNNVIGGISGNHQNITIPSGVSYIVISISHIHIDIFQLEKGVVSTTYEGFYENIPLTEINTKDVFEDAINKGSVIDGDSILDSSIGFDKLKGVKNENLFNKSLNINDNKILDSYYNTSGVLVSNAAYDISYKIPVSENTEFTCKSTFNVNYAGMGAAFDVNDNVIGALNFTHTPSAQDWGVFTTPLLTKYIRLNLIASNKEGLDSMLVYGDENPSIYQNYGTELEWLRNEVSSDSNRFLGKKIAIIGDSITFGYAPGGGGAQLPNYFVKMAAQNLGMSFQNEGISASVIASRASDPNGKDPMVLRYTDLDLDADLIIVAGGTNDWDKEWTPIGTMSSRSNNDFYGAIHNMCIGLINRYPSSDIMFMTPIQRTSQKETTNGLGLKIGVYADVILEVCSYYSIPVLDCFREVTINPSITSQKDLLIPDYTHPNELGHSVIANKLIGFIKKL